MTHTVTPKRTQTYFVGGARALKKKHSDSLEAGAYRQTGKHVFLVATRAGVSESLRNDTPKATPPPTDGPRSLYPTITSSFFFCPADDATCKVRGGGHTECPLQVYQLSRSSERTHFIFLRRDVALFDSTGAPDSF